MHMLPMLAGSSTTLVAAACMMHLLASAGATLPADDGGPTTYVPDDLAPAFSVACSLHGTPGNYTLASKSGWSGARQMRAPRRRWQHAARSLGARARSLAPFHNAIVLVPPPSSSPLPYLPVPYR